MKPRKSLSVYVLLVGILGLLIVAGFFTFQVVDEATKAQVPAKQRELVKPVDGTIEQRIIDNLQTRRIFSREEILTSEVVVSSETISPSATQSSSTSTEAATIQQSEN